MLATPGVTFVNLQYGDCDAEIAQAPRALGVEIWRPPGHRPEGRSGRRGRPDLALDLVIGPANATTNIAAACGAPTWLISTPGAWPRLGTDRYPWYPTGAGLLDHGLRPLGRGDGREIAAALAELARPLRERPSSLWGYAVAAFCARSLPGVFAMARPDLDLDQDAVDPQDQAETADETHLNEDGRRVRHLDE